MPGQAEVWLMDLPPRGVDHVGRPVGWPGRHLVAKAAASVSCRATGQACRPRKQLDSRARCLDCGAWWTASQVAHHAAVARSNVSVGIDVEDRRHRPAAFRRASRWCGVALSAAEQWTQAEAVWKAMGAGRRTPNDSEIPLNESWQVGWQLSRDSQWWIYTTGQPQPWSLAFPADDGNPPNLIFRSTTVAADNLTKGA